MIAQKYKILSIFNKNSPYTLDSFVFTQFNNTIYSTNTLTSEVVPIISTQNIVNFKLIGNTIVYWNTDLYKYNLDTKLTEKTDYNNLIRDVTDNLILFNNGEIYNNGKLIYNIKYTSYTVKDNILYISNTTNLFKLCLLTNKVEKINDYKDIIKIGFVDNNLLVFTSTHIYHKSGVLEMDIEDVSLTNTSFIIQNTEYNSDFQVIKTYPSTVFYNSNVYYDNNTIYYNNLCIVGNLDDVLEVKEVDDKLVFCTGNRLVVINNSYIDSTSNFACIGTQLVNHTDTILSISVYKDYLLTTSRDGTSVLYRNFVLINTFNTGVMNSSHIHDDICIMGGDDGLLVKLILNNDELSNKLNNDEITNKLNNDQLTKKPNNDQLANNFNIEIVKVNDKDINSVFIHRNLIYLGCANKVCKILDFNLTLVKVLSDHKKSVMSVHASSQYICTASSDKTIRIYNQNYECVSVLTGESGFLCSRLVDKKVVSSGYGGIIKVWDIKKGVCTDNFEVSGEVWDFSISNNVANNVTTNATNNGSNNVSNNGSNNINILLGTTNLISSYSIFKDDTAKNNSLHLKNKEFDKVVTSNLKLIYFLIKNDRSLISKYKNKIGDLIKNCGRFKDLEFISDLFENRVFDKEVISTMKKYFEMSDDLYRDLQGLEINFIN